ncbi:MAG: tetratricopeptide repeat protein [Smithella sp.]|nr:tetratricopeptide repeat protein [Smithella sp.]
MFFSKDRNQKLSALTVLFLAVLTLAVYWPVQNYDFINFDDNVYITQNSRVQSGITSENIRWAFSTRYFGLWNPVVWLSFMFDYELFGLNAGGYHWTNVILHLLNAVLLFFLFRNLTGALWRSAFVAALFAVHPMNVESVAWIAERKNVLSTFFWILTMLLYVRYVELPGWKRYLPVVAVFALGLMTKPMLVTLPFVLLLIDYWPLNRTPIDTLHTPEERKTGEAEKKKFVFLFMEKIPLFLLSSMSIYMTMFYSPSTPFNQLSRTIEYDFMQRISNAVYSYVAYLKKLFLPTDLSILYLYVDVSTWQILVSIVILTIITIFVCAYFRKYPYMPVGWFWYLGTLFPVIGIVQIGEYTMADRYAYIPYIGLFVLLAWGVYRLMSKSVYLKKILIIVSVLIIAASTLATYSQMKKWTNTETLFADAIAKDPNNHLAYHILGQEMSNKGNHQQALHYYEMAIKANPAYYLSYKNAAVSLVKTGKRDEALKRFEEALQLKKSSHEPYLDLGYFHLGANNLDKSIEYLSKADEIKPDHLETLNYLGVALVRKGRLEEGIAQFEKALLINPAYHEAFRNLQLTLKMKHKK